MKLGYATAAEVTRSRYKAMLGELIDVENIPYLLIPDRDGAVGEFTVRVVETEDGDLYRCQDEFMDPLFKVQIVKAPANHADLIGQYGLIDGPSIELREGTNA